MADVQVIGDLPESYSALTDFEFWADVLEERALSEDWCETKALLWVQNLQTRLDMARDYPDISRAFSSFFDGVAMQHFDVEKDVAICLDVANVLRKFSECSEEMMILNIVRKSLNKTRKAYIQSYAQAEDRKRMYKDTLICLGSQTGSKILKLALRVKTREYANQFVKALELEQAVKANLIMVTEKYECVAKQVAVRKVQYFLDTWRTQLSRYIKPSFTSTEKSAGNPYQDAFVRVLGVNAYDAVDALFDCNRCRFSTQKINTNIDIGVDVKKLLGFEPKVKSLTQKVTGKESYLEYSGLTDSVFLPPGFKWHGVDQDTRQSRLASSDLSTPVKRQVTVVRDHKASIKHELTFKKGMVIMQLTETNELGLALGFYKRTFPFKKIKIGFFPVKCVSSEPRLVLKKSSKRH